MEDFRRQFLLEAVETLRRLSADLRAAKRFSEPLKRETFRILHTVKGTAQTFGFEAASCLAHELESLADENSFDLLLGGIELLIESLNDENFEIPPSFAGKIRIAAPLKKENPQTRETFPPEVPSEIFSQLSAQEKNRLRAAIRENKNLFCLEVEFQLANFAEELIKFREFLSRTSEIVATFPASKSSVSSEKIGFQMLAASGEILPPLEEFGASVVFQKFAEKLNGASGILKEAARYGKSLAAEFGKKIEFKIRADETNLASDKLKIIFDALTHLVRNAVDHAIIESGTIEINLSDEKNGVRLTILDDGSGFDLEKIKAKAVEKNLIGGAANLSEKELIDLIFLPEFSTKANVSEISGRGIGLDAVKSMIEKNGGRVIAENRNETGAVFEIFLPR